ncbi:Blp family class II bacteriocin [Bacillus pseudomycoides]|uniref:Blp family class II bacteriocin n=1 Tax=Bacillus pseudomycoides TaxID=64104 RepID=UPI000BFDCE4A|nr:Blp family class II bacteriocin [Bacillus pseudomycoides]PGD99991.1 hypothetical protein COM49_22200 [Bacillus pseudomycoides]PHG19668.1 hypothetical protein COI47_18350 [Bacillus pseudomycoides]
MNNIVELNSLELETVNGGVSGTNVVGGALVGAGIGARAGSWIAPGVGTAWGAGIGAVAGGVVGAFAE